MKDVVDAWLDGDWDTVNPFNGCKFECYGGKCWAQRFSHRLKGMGVRGYENGFEPTFVPDRMSVPNADVIFLGDMGDIAFQETEDVERIIREMIVPNPHTFFLLMTKSPGTYERFLDKLPENVILSATIETNRDYDLSKAPNTSERKARMESLKWPTKHVCVEPILDFDVSTFVDWIREIDPVLVTIGYDNYSCGLPEPSREKTLDFAERISDFTAVHKKEIRETSPKEGANRTNR